MHFVTSGSNKARLTELLGDLGFHLIEDFLSEDEEAELLKYWGPDSPIYSSGSDEKLTHRRFFHYGPLLPLESKDTTKSTLGVVSLFKTIVPPSSLIRSGQDGIRMNLSFSSNEWCGAKTIFLYHIYSFLKNSILTSFFVVWLRNNLASNRENIWICFSRDWLAWQVAVVGLRKGYAMAVPRPSPRP